MFTNILLPTDGLKICDDALSAGIELAKALNAKVTGVHVTRKLTPQQILEAYHPEILWGPLEAEKAQEAMAHLEELHKASADKYLTMIQTRAEAAGVDCEVVYLTGESPLDGIMKTAKEKGCDLIYIASHSRSGIAGALLGTVTSKVLSHSTIPVLVHRCD
jgi:nucleotide-binding universal stress UspA family protein